MLLNILEGPYLLDLLDQPGALQRTWKHLTDDADLRRVAQQARDGHYRRIVLTGMGSSQYSLYPMHLALIAHGLPSYLVETAELIHYQRELLRSDSLLVVVSQSGQSAEIVALVDAVRGRVPLIALTNTPESPLAGAADVLLRMHAGPESTVSCKTYVTSLLLLDWLASHFTGQDSGMVREELAGAEIAAAEYLKDWQKHVAYLEGLLRPVRRIFVTGRGPSLAAAETGGLIMKESVRFQAEGLSCAAFRHGPFEVLQSDVLVVVMAGDGRSTALNRSLSHDVRNAGGQGEIVDSHDAAPAFLVPKVEPRLHPIVEILPVQMMTLALGLLSGRQPGRFELATKITSTE